MERILIGEDNVVYWLRLKDNTTGEYVDNATLRMTLKDGEGNAISGASNLTLAYIPGSNGDYRGTISASVAGTLINGVTYYLEVTATGGGTGFRRIPLLAAYHGAG